MEDVKLIRQDIFIEIKHEEPATLTDFSVGNFLTFFFFFLAEGFAPSHSLSTDHALVLKHCTCLLDGFSDGEKKMGEFCEAEITNLGNNEGQSGSHKTSAASYSYPSFVLFQGPVFLQVNINKT